MIRWHHQLNGHEFEQTPGYGEAGVLQSMGSQRVRHDLATELNWLNKSLGPSHLELFPFPSQTLTHF